MTRGRQEGKPDLLHGRVENKDLIDPLDLMQIKIDIDSIVKKLNGMNNPSNPELSEKIERVLLFLGILKGKPEATKKEIGAINKMLSDLGFDPESFKVS